MGIEEDEGRQAEQRLAAELAGIHAKAFAGLGRRWSAFEILALLTDPKVTVHVVHCEGQPPDGSHHTVGFAFYRAVADEAELLTLAVTPKVQRAGFGAGLLAACEEGARTSGATRLFLEVASGNAAAGALYGRAGYHECGRRKDYYLLPGGGRDDAVVMAKPL